MCLYIKSALKRDDTSNFKSAAALFNQKVTAE